MQNDAIRPILEKLTYNGAVAVRNTIRDPHPDIPRLINGTHGRLFTGLGKWTSLSARGVRNNIRACGLLEEFDAQPVWRPGPNEEPWMVHVLTDLGMEVGQYLHEHWEDVFPTLRDAKDR